MDTDPRLLDFATVRTPSRPNAWLIAPPGLAGGRPSEAAPVFPLSAERAADTWRAIIESEPRTRILAVSADGLRIEAEQRSAMFGFVDRISAQVIPLDRDRATIAVYSRAQTGYWDLGVNRRRLRDWLGRLEATATGPQAFGTLCSAEDPA